MLNTLRPAPIARPAAWPLLLLALLPAPGGLAAVELTPGERAWVATHPSIRVRIGDRPPFEMMVDGQARGLAVDYMRLVCDKLGMEPEFVQITGDKEAINQRLETGDGFDAVLLTLPTPERRERLALSAPYLRYPFALFTQADRHFALNLEAMRGETIALERGFATNRWLARDYPDIEILPANSTAAALEAVAFGRAAGYMGNLAAGAYIVQRKGYHNVKAAGTTPYGDNALALAAAPDFAPFAGLFDRVMADLTQAERRRIERPWLYVEREFRIHWPLLFSISGGALLLLGLMAYWNRRLRQEVGQRKAAEAGLQQAKDRAEAANRAKSAFLANMSHELRTPLNAVLGYAQILANDERLEPALRQPVATIEHSGKYLLTLLNDILDLAKIEAERFELAPAACDPRDFLEGLAEVFRLRAAQKGLRLSLGCSDRLPPALKADERRLRQIGMNLLGNAIKFTEQGEVRIEADYRQGKLYLAIIDSGIGVPPERLEELFKPFQQVGDDPYKQQGTGLGLAISRSLAEQMDGALEVTSTPGAGSRFELRVPLPALHAAPPQALPADALAAVKGYLRGDGQSAPLRILVVDDNGPNRRMLRDLLGPLGFEIDEAVNGVEALWRAREQHPDLILMDLVMPERNGLEATRDIKADKMLQAIPVIAVSASVYDENHSQSRAAGCDDYLDKPVKRQQVLELLERHLPLAWQPGPEHQSAREEGAAEFDEAATVQALAALPPPRRAALHDALLSGHRKRIKAMLSEIGGDSPRLATTLQARIDDFDYPWVLKQLAASENAAEFR